MPVYKGKSKTKPWYVKKNNKTYRGFATKAEAKQFEISLYKDNGEDDDINPVYIRTLAKEYLDYKKSNFSYGTYMKQANFFNAIILPNIPNKRVNKFNERDCLKFRSYVHSLDYSTVYKNDILTAFKGLFHFAQKYYGLQRNPTIVIDKIKQTYEEDLKDIKRQQDIWTYDDFELFINYIDDYTYKVFFTTLFFTGMRLGECLALNWSDINENKITIIKNLTRKTDKGQYEIKAPKTKSSYRTITIDSNLQKVLEDYKAIEMTSPDFKEDWFVFGRLKPLPQTSIDRIKDTAIKKSGVKRIRIHDLRHSFATNLINNGVSWVAVSKTLGHSSITETLETYTHLLQKTDEKMVENLGKNSTNLLKIFSKSSQG